MVLRYEVSGIEVQGDCGCFGILLTQTHKRTTHPLTIHTHTAIVILVIETTDNND